ncbi:glycoside hydrolase [Nocardioides marmoriginsengisoli]|uniref:Glycoside hydrolase n=1 Tax=Nocardioides marmoriginsengisoli TaxID=661483 RepID=A0A3N0CL05_9ACTN|nr:glycoside hydrolase family 43 protein [Nocardioides marmoriginsengisoli]RNL63706.1 glycoside hydrolase [Nocardioides marmoriginsengisoli]
MRARSRIPIALLVAVLGAGLLPAGSGARPAPIGQDPIVPGEVYTGDFPDPAVLRIGTTYYAYATTSSGLNLPTLISKDLRTWRAAPVTTATPAGDSLPRTATWSAGKERSDGRFRATTWAPTVTRLGPGRFVLAYSTQVAGAPGKKMCVSLATSSRPTGPFVDTSTRPLICPAQGAIDPQVWVAPTGRPWIVWKLDHHPAGLFTTPMNAAGTALAGRRYFLTGIRQPWEGNIIENPAMIRYAGRFYLFYSANSYASTRYAISYLVCKTGHGPCKRPRKKPLIATDKYRAGPGGPMPFVDTAGRLRVAYHAWRAGAVGYPDTAECRGTALGCPQRRLFVAHLRPDRKGLLKVVTRRAVRTAR